MRACARVCECLSVRLTAHIPTNSYTQLPTLPPAQPSIIPFIHQSKLPIYPTSILPSIPPTNLPPTQNRPAHQSNYPPTRPSIHPDHWGVLENGFYHKLTIMSKVPRKNNNFLFFRYLCVFSRNFRIQSLKLLLCLSPEEQNHKRCLCMTSGNRFLKEPLGSHLFS